MFIVISERNYRMRISERQIKEAKDMSLGSIDGMPVAFKRLVSGVITDEIVAVPEHEFIRWYDLHGNAPYVYEP